MSLKTVRTIVLSAADKLIVSGGGACSETSVEALNIAIPHTKTGGDILFYTQDGFTTPSITFSNHSD